jgi:hypothetical protein
VLVSRVYGNDLQLALYINTFGVGLKGGTKKERKKEKDTDIHRRRSNTHLRVIHFFVNYCSKKLVSRYFLRYIMDVT